MEMSVWIKVKEKRFFCVLIACIVFILNSRNDEKSAKNKEKKIEN